MTTANQRNFLWSVLVIGIGVFMLLAAVDIVPENLSDLAQRSWAVLLVILGLNMLLIERVPFGNWLALGISAVLLLVIGFFAYDAQSEKMRDDYHEAIEPVILGDHIQGVNVDVSMLDATVVFQHMQDGSRAVMAEFAGSTESRVSISVQENEQNIVTLTINEERPNSIPNLEAVGRGELIVYLPVGIPINDFSFDNVRGSSTLDFRFLDVPRFNVIIEDAPVGVDLHLPRTGITISDVSIQHGSLRIFVDPAKSLQIQDTPANTEIDPNRYQLLADGSLESRGGLTAFDFSLQLNIPDGSLIIQPPEQG